MISPICILNLNLSGAACAKHSVRSLLSIVRDANLAEQLDGAFRAAIFKTSASALSRVFFLFVALFFGNEKVSSTKSLQRSLYNRDSSATSLRQSVFVKRASSTTRTFVHRRPKGTAKMMNARANLEHNLSIRPQIHCHLVPCVMLRTVFSKLFTLTNSFERLWSASGSRQSLRFSFLRFLQLAILRCSYGALEVRVHGSNANFAD